MIKRVGAIHTQAMRLRLRGMTYEDISHEVGRTPGTVKQWFQGDQTFRQGYEEYKAQLTEQAEAQIVEAGNDAVQTLTSLLGARSEYVRLAAAQDILNRLDVRSPERHELTGRNGEPLQVQVQTWLDLVKHADSGTSEHGPGPDAA